MMMTSEWMFCTLPSQTFTRQKHGATKQLTFSAFPMALDFNDLIKQKSTIIPNVSNQDLLNTVITLYDVCLPDIGVENIRDTVCERGARTILLLRNFEDVLKEYQDNLWPDVDVKSSPVEGESNGRGMSKFTAVFSDSESEEEQDSDSEVKESEKFQSTMKEFLAMVIERRHQRKHSPNIVSNIGIECCVVAALTYKNSTLILRPMVVILESYLKDTQEFLTAISKVENLGDTSWTKGREKIIEITLLSTRKRYRGCGVAKYIITLLKDASFVGFYDAIVTHADNRAVDLFSCCDFCDDIILNSRFRALDQDWTNVTTMSYFPPFSAGPAACADAKDLEAEITKWSQKSLAAHEAQAIFMRRVFQEMKALRKQVASQEMEIQKLKAVLEKERMEKTILIKELLQHQVKKLQNIHFSQLGEHKEEETMTLKPNTNEKIELDGQEMELQATVMTALSQQAIEEIKTYTAKLHDPDVYQRLYYCDRRGQLQPLMDILSNGFSPEDIQQEEYGTGLYFSTSLATAITMSLHYCVLVADVYTGKVQIDGVKPTNRTCPPEGFDSIQIPGRLSISEPEFLVFSHLQAIPVSLLKYRSGPSQDGKHT
ncbi:uncharacterized protein [Hyperolius riggenbachi]|uniref:uncharacterized protein isoform X2 n=1 Tax=Hyperolius riggenbachi TaxID=752182 RepID=UPI0035A29D6C